MESELSDCSGIVMLNNQNYKYKDMRNISVQTGEEFSPEFLRDGISKRTPSANDFNPTIGFQRTKRSDSEDFSDFCPSRGYEADYSPSDSPNSNQLYSKASGNPDRTLSGKKMKFLCSFGGKILPRPNDAKLRYVGGDTRIISITKDLTYNELVEKTMTICNYNHTIKYQLPGEDLDSLISVSSDEDLHHMIDEYHDLERKSQRLRIFLVSCGDLEKSDSDCPYVAAVNGVSPRKSSSRESLESPWANILDGSPTVRPCENVTCPYGSKNNYPYLVDIPGNDNFGFSDNGPVIDGPNQVFHMVRSHAPPMAGSHFRKPSNEFRSHFAYSPSYSDSRSGFMNAEKFVRGTKEDVINNNYTPNADFSEHKQNLPQIICHPESKLSVHVPKSYNAAENPTEVWKEPSGNYKISPNEPDFLIKSQKARSNTSSLGYHGLQPVEDKENDNQSKLREERADINSHNESYIYNDAFTNSRSSDSFREIRVPENPVIDEHCDEAEIFAYASENDDLADDGDKDEPITDAAIIEMEANIYGLQIIKNADLEELQELGSGTFGTVYHGKWRGTDVAIKRIKKSCFVGGSSEQERLTKDFWREAKILSRLHHPNIVAFYGVVPDGPGVTLATVSEFMANGSLRHVLLRKDRGLDRRKKVIIALDASFGMEYLHLKNIVHFDLKCDNLLVNLGDSQRPICKVTDFGLSRIKQNTLVSGGVRGTLPWMAPELLTGNSNRVSEKVDVFSFGIAMWEILTGEEPYIDMHCGAIIGGIVSNTLRPPIPERCDPEWRKLMEECWSHEPEARPSFTDITKRLQVMSTALQPKKFSNRIKQR